MRPSDRTSVFFGLASLSLRRGRQTEGAGTMNAMPGEKPPPKSTDLDGWRQAIASASLPSFRLEAIVAAIQDLGPSNEGTVRNALAKHLSDSIIKMLRRRVGFNHPNQGEDIIYRVHSEIFEALLAPNSKDGKALREAFGPRVMFRLKTAIAVESRHSRIPVEGKIKKSSKKPGGDKVAEIVRTTDDPEPPEPANDADSSDGEEAVAHNSNRDLSLLDGVRDADEQINVDNLLRVVTDERKRLAFYLYMDRVPFGSKKGQSIAKAIGKSSKTAEQWVEEVQQLLKLDKEVRELRKSSMGDEP
jgi:hypothetical protein